MSDRPAKCPACGEEFSLAYVASLKPQSKMQFKMSPAAGERLSAATVGGGIDQFGKLLIALNKDLGVEKTEILVDDISTKDGEIIVTVLVTRFTGMTA